MNKLKQLTDTQDAKLRGITHKDIDGIIGSCGQPCYQCSEDIAIKKHIQSSRTALIEEVIEMGKSKIDYLKRHKVMSEESKYDVIREINLFLAPLKEVIDKEQ